MSPIKKSRDIMVDIFDYPHIPYWFTIKQALGIIEVSLASTKKRPEPLAILVFDEKYNLLGTLGLKDIVKGLEPRFLTPTTKAQVHDEDESGLAMLWETLFDTGSKTIEERPVSEVMIPARHFVIPDDPITKAAYLMIRNDLVILPVLEGGKKFVGLVRMLEIFHELSKAMLKK